MKVGRQNSPLEYFLGGGGNSATDIVLGKREQILFNIIKRNEGKNSCEIAIEKGGKIPPRYIHRNLGKLLNQYL